MSSQAHFPQAAPQEAASSPLPEMSPETCRRIAAYDNPEYIAIARHLFHAVFFNLLYIASLSPGDESLMYEVLAHLLHAFCFAATTGFSCSPQPRIFKDTSRRSPDFGVFQHLRRSRKLAFLWEAKPIDATVDWISEDARRLAQAAFRTYYPQLCQQALFTFHSDPNIDDVYIFFSVGIYFSLLVFSRPLEGGSPGSQARAAKKQKRDYEESIIVLEQRIAQTLQEQLTPDILYFAECIVNATDWTLSECFKKALYVAASQVDRSLEIQKSWMRQNSNETQAAAADKKRLEMGVQIMEGAREDTVERFQEVLDELLGANVLDESAEEVKISPAYRTNAVAAELSDRILRSKSARQNTAPSDEIDFGSSHPAGGGAFAASLTNMPSSPYPGQDSQAGPSTPTRADHQSVAAGLQSPFSPTSPRSSPVVDVIARGHLRRGRSTGPSVLASSGAQAGPSGTQTRGKRPFDQSP